MTYLVFEDTIGPSFRGEGIRRAIDMSMGLWRQRMAVREAPIVKRWWSGVKYFMGVPPKLHRTSRGRPLGT